MLDLKIINGRIIDGSGDAAYCGDVGIAGDNGKLALQNLVHQEAYSGRTLGR